MGLIIKKFDFFKNNIDAGKNAAFFMRVKIHTPL